MLEAPVDSRPAARSLLFACAVGVAACSASSVSTIGRARAVPTAGPAAQSPSGVRAAKPGTPAAETTEADPDQPAGVLTVAVPVGAGSALVHGRSTVTVHTPIEDARKGILGFAHYAEFMPHYSNCRVLGRTPSGGRDVYMEIEALHGAVHLWARVEVPKPSIVDGRETYPTRFLEGNVRDFQATWRLRKIDEAKTELSLEVFLHPKIPLPDSLVNEENLDGSASGVSAMRTRIEAAAK